MNEHEPKLAVAEASFETPPTELAGNGVAETEWRRLVPMLRASRMVTEVERSVLIVLCQQWSRYLEAQSKVAIAGMVVRGQLGEAVVNPYLKVSDAALGHCHRLWTELGLTPSARSRVAALPLEAAPVSKWAGIL